MSNTLTVELNLTVGSNPTWASEGILSREVWGRAARHADSVPQSSLELDASHILAFLRFKQYFTFTTIIRSITLIQTPPVLKTVTQCQRPNTKSLSTFWIPILTLRYVFAALLACIPLYGIHSSISVEHIAQHDRRIEKSDLLEGPRLTRRFASSFSL